MSDYDRALATMDDDGYGCSITASPDERYEDALAAWQQAQTAQEGMQLLRVMMGHYRCSYGPPVQVI